MKLKHSAVKSSVFVLVNTFEFDLEVGGHFLPTRVELFQDTELKGHWRCRLWERELFHLTLTVPVDGRKKQRAQSDEELLVERTWELSDRFEDFEARSAKAALKLFMGSLKDYLKRVAG
ncbi:MAG: hypothetical protein KJ072_06215 [Verrucomicrobia bacterium]|nr:hypothetical protein [Verrucomicrobiota bacterium]